MQNTKELVKEDLEKGNAVNGSKSSKFQVVLEAWKPDLSLLKVKRVVRSALALTIAVALILAKPTSDFMGRNVFLIGTVTIYLFPKSTVGAQVFNSVVSYTGFLLGLAWYNAVEFIAVLLDPEGSSKRVFLFISFLVAAFTMGFIRSKWLWSYLGINFFMVVNIFGGIDIIKQTQDSWDDYFYVFTFGTCLALLCSFLFCENSTNIIQKQVEDLTQLLEDNLSRTQSCIADIESATVQFSGCEKTDMHKIRAEIDILASQMNTTRMEPFFSRISPEILDVFYDETTCIRTLLQILEEVTHDLYCNPQITACISWRDAKPVVIECLEFSQIAIVNIKNSLQCAFNGTEAVKMTKKSRGGEQGRETLNSNRAQASQVSSEDNSCTGHFSVLACLQRKRDQLLGKQSNHTEKLESLAIIDQILDCCVALAISHYSMNAKLDSARRRCTRQRSFWRPRSWRKTHSSAFSSLSHHNAGRRASVISRNTEPDMRFMKIEPGESTPKIAILRYKFSHWSKMFRESRHNQYAFKFMLVMGLLILPAFISDWRNWYDSFRGQWSLISALVAFESTRGLVIRSALMKVVGAVSGGLMALVVHLISSNPYSITVLTFVCSLPIFYFAMHQRWAKAGLVSALAYNIVIGVGYTQDPPVSAFVKRITTLPIGLVVAVFVHITIFPYHARREFISTITGSLNGIGMLFQYLSFSAETNLNVLVCQKKLFRQGLAIKNRLRYAQELVKLTKFEPSLRGPFPKHLYLQVLKDMILVYENAVLMQDLAWSSDATAEEAHYLRAIVVAITRDLLLLAHSLDSKILLVTSATSSCTSALFSYQEYLTNSHRRTTNKLVDSLSSLHRFQRLEKYLASISGNVQDCLLYQTNPITALAVGNDVDVKISPCTEVCAVGPYVVQPTSLPPSRSASVAGRNRSRRGSNSSRVALAEARYNNTTPSPIL